MEAFQSAARKWQKGRTRSLSDSWAQALEIDPMIRTLCGGPLLPCACSDEAVSSAIHESLVGSGWVNLMRGNSARRVGLEILSLFEPLATADEKTRKSFRMMMGAVERSARPGSRIVSFSPSYCPPVRVGHCSSFCHSKAFDSLSILKGLQSSAGSRW